MFVTGQYFEVFIKGGERNKIASTGQIQITASRKDQTTPTQFQKHVLVGANKTKLL